eukprot:2728-Heterococcus_DN1.PRE.2
MISTGVAAAAAAASGYDRECSLRSVSSSGAASSAVVLHQRSCAQQQAVAQYVSTAATARLP